MSFRWRGTKVAIIRELESQLEHWRGQALDELKMANKWREEADRLRVQIGDMAEKQLHDSNRRKEEPREYLTHKWFSEDGIHCCSRCDLVFARFNRTEAQINDLLDSRCPGPPGA